MAENRATVEINTYARVRIRSREQNHVSKKSNRSIRERNTEIWKFCEDFSSIEIPTRRLRAISIFARYAFALSFARTEPPHGLFYTFAESVRANETRASLHTDSHRIHVRCNTHNYARASGSAAWTHHERKRDKRSVPAAVHRLVANTLTPANKALRASPIFA